MRPWGATRDHLYLRHGVNDLVKNRGVNLALTTLLVLTAFLMATGARVMERTLGSVDALIEVARPQVRLKLALSDVAGYVGALALSARLDAPDKSAWLRG